MMPRAGWAATNAGLKIAFHFGLPGVCAGHGPADCHRAQRAQSLLLLSELTGFRLPHWPAGAGCVITRAG